MRCGGARVRAPLAWPHRLGRSGTIPPQVRQKGRTHLMASHTRQEAPIRRPLRAHGTARRPLAAPATCAGADRSTDQGPEAEPASRPPTPQRRRPPSWRCTPAGHWRTARQAYVSPRRRTREHPDRSAADPGRPDTGATSRCSGGRHKHGQSGGLAGPPAQTAAHRCRPCHHGTGSPTARWPGRPGQGRWWVRGRRQIQDRLGYESGHGG